MDSGTREQRIQANNERFRGANEAIHEQADRLGADMEQLPFLCECPAEDCVEILTLTREETQTSASTTTTSRRSVTRIAKSRSVRSSSATMVTS